MSSYSEYSYQCGKCQRNFSSHKKLARHYKEHSCHPEESHSKSSVENAVIILGTNMRSLIGKEQRVPSIDDSGSDSCQMQSTSDTFITVSSPSMQPYEAQKLPSLQSSDSFQRRNASEASSSLTNDKIRPRKRYMGYSPYTTSVDSSKEKQRDNFPQKRSLVTSQKLPERKQRGESSQRNGMHRKNFIPNESLLDVEDKNDVEIVYEKGKPYEGKTALNTDNLFCPQCQQRFTDKLSLHRHFAWHLNNDCDQTIENLFCPQCHQKFADKLALHRHFAWHLNIDSDQGSENLFCPQCQQRFADKLALHRHFAWHLNNDGGTEHRLEVSHTDTNNHSPERLTEDENKTSVGKECPTICKLLESPGSIQKVYVKWILEGNEEEYRTALMMEKLIVHQWMKSAV